MKQLLTLLLFLGILINSSAQSSAVDYAVAYSVKLNGFKSMIVKNKKLIREERDFNATPEHNFSFLIEKMGLDSLSSNEMTARDILRSKYPDTGDWQEVKAKFEYSHYDSLTNSLTISENNTMSAWTYVYIFDSSGTLIETQYDYQGEASGCHAESITTYAYLQEQNTVITTVTNKTYKSTTETEWDSAHQLPLKQIISYSQTGKTTVFNFTYKDNCLNKINVIEMLNTEILKTYTLEYYFSN